MIKNQPVFVLAGVMLDEQIEHIVLQKMEEMFQLHREQEELGEYLSILLFRSYFRPEKATDKSPRARQLLNISVFIHSVIH